MEVGLARKRYYSRQTHKVEVEAHNIETEAHNIEMEAQKTEAHNIEMEVQKTEVEAQIEMVLAAVDHVDCQLD